MGKKKSSKCVVPCGMCDQSIEFEYDAEMDEWQTSEEVFHYQAPYRKGQKIQEKDKFFCDAECCARYFADNDGWTYDRDDLEMAGGDFT